MMRILTIAVLAILVGACGNREVEFKKVKGDACTAEDTALGANLVCEDGTVVELYDGKDGQNGADGKDGRDGESGLTGAQGLQGAKGDKGDKGDTGATGATGAKGADGAQGPKGDAGAAGSNGADGTNGSDGLNGKDGADGAAGPQGLAGKDGKDGMALTSEYLLQPQVCTPIELGLYALYYNEKIRIYEDDQCDPPPVASLHEDDTFFYHDGHMFTQDGIDKNILAVVKLR